MMIHTLYTMCVCVCYEADHLVPDNHLVCSSQGKTVSPALCIAQSPVVLCMGRGSASLLVLNTAQLVFAHPCW